MPTAKGRKSLQPIEEQDINLAIDWLTGKITRNEALRTFDHGKGTNYTYRIALCLREAYNRGIIKL